MKIRPMKMSFFVNVSGETTILGEHEKKQTDEETDEHVMNILPPKSTSGRPARITNYDEITA